MQPNEDLTQRVMAQLVALIEQRNYRPGERLPSERELAEWCEVGRGVVREVLSILENLRYIERRPQSGVYLGKDASAVSLETLVLASGMGLALSPKVLAQSLEVRRILEINAVTLACQRRTEEDLAEIEGLMAEWDRRLQSGEPLAELDKQFHLCLFKASQNEIFVRMVTPFFIMSQSRRNAFFVDRQVAKESNHQHRQLVEALRARDSATAVALISSHIGRVERSFGIGGDPTDG
jgi:GntR family transcriptional repressor for pyruvate dehydrogenase complex